MITRRSFTRKRVKVAILSALGVVFVIYGIGLAVFVSDARENSRNAPNSPELLSLTNQERDKKGLNLLENNPALEKTAAEKCYFMQEHRYFEHDGADRSWVSFFDSYMPEVEKEVGENLGLNYLTSQATINGWMDSPKHRANILDDRYTQVGFGICSGSLGKLIIQHFSNL